MRTDTRTQARPPREQILTEREMWPLLDGFRAGRSGQKFQPARPDQWRHGWLIAAKAQRNPWARKQLEKGKRR